jgi:hypothetical protein
MDNEINILTSNHVLRIRTKKDFMFLYINVTSFDPDCRG